MSLKVTVETSSESETIYAGEHFGRNLKGGDVVCLYGYLGVGKTVFIKGIARAIGIEEREITSASFIIISEHYGKYPLYHIDLYRVYHERDIIDLGIEEYLYTDGITVIEWSERLSEVDCTYRVHLSYLGENKRKIIIVGNANTLTEK